MSELIEKLLQPVSAEQPCGPDLSYDPRFDELETLLKGKPEVEIGSVLKPAEPPDWMALQKKSIEFLGHSKNLRVAIMLNCSLLKTGGFAGFVDGLGLIRGLLEQHWGNLYPALDPDDNNDPTQRLNYLRSLTPENGRGSLSSWLTPLDYLYTTPLCQAKGAPPLTFDDLIAARKKESGGEGAPADAPDMTKVSAMIRDTGVDKLAAQQALLQQALETTQAIDQFLGNTLGTGNSISFGTLEGTLKEIITGVAPYLSGSGSTTVTAEGATSADGGGAREGGTSGSISVSGSIRSREDVVRALNAICEFYDQVEPSSPVPYLLRRAQKLAMMNFVEAVQELNIATVDSLTPSRGSAVEEPPPPAS
jgi:type VI secretion system protein ImpA